MKRLILFTVLLSSLPGLAWARLVNQVSLINKHQIIQQELRQMVFIKGGTYIMGTNDKKYFDITGDNAHPHKVTLSSFYFPKYLVSGTLFNSYLKLINNNKELQYDYYNAYVNDMPVEADWRSANRYCQWLSKNTDLPFSLPTEAQWEYVARDGGKDIPYPTSNGKLEVGRNYPDTDTFNKKIKGVVFSVNNVQEIPVNKLGIHQMGGNVSEWMQDWYVHDYYWHSPVNNPQGPKTYPGTLKQNITRYGAPQKVVRGINNTGVSLSLGGHDPEDKAMLIAGASNYSRDSSPITAKDIGFRCVINSDQSMSALKAVAQQHLRAQ